VGLLFINAGCGRIRGAIIDYDDLVRQVCPLDKFRSDGIDDLTNGGLFISSGQAYRDDGVVFCAHKALDIELSVVVFAKNRLLLQGHTWRPSWAMNSDRVR
jgi:hypothetical protein